MACILINKVCPLNQTSVLYFDFGGTTSEYNRLMSLNLSGTYWHKPSTRPPSCTSPLQPPIYVTDHSMKSLLQILCLKFEGCGNRD